MIHDPDCNYSDAINSSPDSDFCTCAPRTKTIHTTLHRERLYDSYTGEDLGYGPVTRITTEVT